MNIYQGLLFLHGFRVLPEDVTEGGAAAAEHVAAAAQATDMAMVPDQFGVGTGTELAAAGARA